MGEYKAVASKVPETEREGEKYPSFSLPLAWLPPTKCSLENEAPDNAEIREKKDLRLTHLGSEQSKRKEGERGIWFPTIKKSSQSNGSFL